LAGAGNDTLQARGDNDLIDGGPGTDTLYLYLTQTTADLTLYLTDPSLSQALPGGGSIIDIERFYLVVGDGDHTILLGPGDDTVRSGAGDDVIDLGDGDGQAIGGDGNDHLLAGNGNVFLSAESGDDRLDVRTGHGGSAVLSGGGGNDRLEWTATEQQALGRLEGNEGNDELVAIVQAGATIQLWLDGGPGNDQLSAIGAHAGSVHLNGGDGRDVLQGSAGNDVLSDQDVVLSPTAYYNPLNGNWYQLFNELMSLEEARRFASSRFIVNESGYFEPGYLVTITSAEEQAFLSTIFGMKPFWIGASDIWQEGVWTWMEGPEAGRSFYLEGLDSQPNYANWLTGEPNSYWGDEDAASWGFGHGWIDTAVTDDYYLLVEYGDAVRDESDLVGHVGDTLLAGDGDDIIISHGEDDHIDGGDGDDRLTIDLGSTFADLNLSFLDPFSVLALPGGGSIVNVESVDVIAGGGNDVIISGRGPNTLQGGAGDDRLDLSAGSGSAHGERGNDTLVGGGLLDSASTLVGGGGDDLLIAGQGFAVMEGSAGADIFRFTAAPGQLSSPDVLTDFSVAEGDRIELDLSAFPELGSVGSLAEESFLMGEVATTVHQRLLYYPQRGALLYDPDGGAGEQAIQFATLSPGLALRADLFTLV
jgi:Ca2+-binding RTX toxin-like protein